jgi:hypothetical protein
MLYHPNYYFSYFEKLISAYDIILLSVVGASHGILPHVGNADDQVTLTQIGIQVTAR